MDCSLLASADFTFIARLVLIIIIVILVRTPFLKQAQLGTYTPLTNENVR
jgi:hypothetical protein